MRRYVNANVNRKSATVINYSVKMVAVVAETVVFMFIGMTSVLDLVDWHPAFFFTALVACALYRPIGVVAGCWFINKFRTIKLSWLDQFIMAYGGLRGPIAYALCALISKELIEQKDVLLSACMGVIFFTVYVQGGTIRFLVEGLHVKRANTAKPTMNQRLHERLIDHAMAGIEDIAGLHGSQYMRVTFEQFDQKFLKPLLLREVPNTRESGIIKTFSKLNVQDAIRNAKERGSSAALSDMNRVPPAATADRRMSHLTTTESVAEALNMAFHRNYSGSVTENAATFRSSVPGVETALDLQILDAPPMRKKDVDDARIRHILDDAMYKPRNKPKYAPRHVVNEHKKPVMVNQNPEARWQVRRLMSSLSPGSSSGEHVRTRRNETMGARPNRSKNLLTIPQVSFTKAGAQSTSGDRSGSHRKLILPDDNMSKLVIGEVDEGGIDITIGDSGDDEPNGITISAPGEPPSPGREASAQESQLPWRQQHDEAHEPSVAPRSDRQDSERIDEENEDSV